MAVTLLQIFRNFFLAAVYLYITSTETSLLINIEVVVTAIPGLHLFGENPTASSDIVWDAEVITVGIILFIRTLPETIQLRAPFLSLPGSSGKLWLEPSSSRENHCRQSHYLRRQKCGISGFTMFWGRHVSHAFS